MAAPRRAPGGRGVRWTHWHRIANLAVLFYLAATAVLIPLHAAGIVQRWTVVHVLLLGAVTNAIVTWTAHFTAAMLHAPNESPRFAALRLAGLNVGVLGVLTGIGHGLPAVTVASATVLAATVVAHLTALIRMGRHGLGGRFTAAARFYWAAPLALLCGMAAGSVMGVGADGAWHERVYAAHLSLNLLGWVGLSVLGTLFLLWPTVLGTRMVDGAMRAARRSLPLCAAGLALAVTGMLAGWGPVAAAGLVLYLAGTAVSLVPAVQAWRRRAPERPAALMLAAAAAWLLIALGVQTAAALTAATAGDLAERISSMLPWFLAGFVVQVLIGALTHLLPMVLGGTRAIALLNRFGRTRVIAANAGIALVALPLPRVAGVVGWALATASLAAFVALAVGAAVAFRKSRPRAAERSSDAPRHRRRTLIAGLSAAALMLAVPIVVVNLGSAPQEGGEPLVLTEGGEQTVEVSLESMSIEPGSITVAPGTVLTLSVTNNGRAAHDLVFGDLSTPMLAPGESAELELGEVTGPLEGWCTVMGHKEAGMTLHVGVDGGGHEHGDDGADPTEAVIDPGEEPSAGFEPYDAALPPAGGGEIHEVTMRISNETVEVAPGVTQEMWTFNGTVPGPTLRGEVGDEFVVTLVNDGTQAHSIDFHASFLAPDRPMRSIEPGESLVYEFTAVAAGAWMYHCGTDPMIHHLGNGMYGAVVIDPPDLAPVDREYVVVQSELYLGEEGGPGDFTAMAAGEPDAVVFNGYYDQYRHAPLAAAAGERVRIWVVDAGIARPSSFHVVGAQFDTVFNDGGYLVRPGDPGGGAAQALALQPGQGGFVEFTLPEAGHYPFVTHVMVDANRGATGVIAVE